MPVETLEPALGPALATNGVTWIPPNYVAAVDDTCFICGDGEEPVKISSTPYQDAYNVVQVNWNNRANQYAPEVTPESDQAACDRYGSRIEDPQSWPFITTLPAATFAASMRVKRNVYARNTYEFSLPFTYAYLEPMDVLELTTSSAWAAGLNNSLGIVNLPVRITKIVDNPGEEGLQITAEDYPFGAHQPTIFNKAVADGQVQPDIYAEPGDSEVVIFEATSRLTGFEGNQIWIGASGASEHWGKCNVYASMDGDTYKQIGVIESRARSGLVGADLASGSDPDTLHALVIILADGCGPLESATADDADAPNTLCYVDGELLSYSACSLTGDHEYTADTYLRRGFMGSSIGAHTTGGVFLRLDDAVFKYTYDVNWRGKTIYLKFQSVNTRGNAPQPLSSLTPVVFTIPGNNPGTADAASGLVFSHISTVLNKQGSIVTIEPVPTPSYTKTPDSITFASFSISRQLSDGSSITVTYPGQTYSGLSNSTTYYFSPRIRTVDYVMEFANSDPPPTSPSSGYAIQAHLDGYFSMAPFSITTLSAGGGSGSGGGEESCPDAPELVDVRGKGHIPVIDVQAGDWILGCSFQKGADVYRRVTSKRAAPCAAWQIVKGHKVSPCEPIWDGSHWTPAFRDPGAVFNADTGLKVELHVDSDEYAEHNFWLVSGDRLLIHNNIAQS